MDFFQTSPVPADAMTGYYNPYLVALSFIMAFFASYVVFDFACKIRQQDLYKNPLWQICAGAFAMGAGIFSMHFIGMLAFIMPMPMHYYPGLTFLSLMLPIIASGFALVLINRPYVGVIRILLGGSIFGLAIATMHYIGMEAMVGVKIHYRPSLFLLSIVIAVGTSICALWMMIKVNEVSLFYQHILKVVSSFIMGIAICGMHYTGMAAAIFIPLGIQEKRFSIVPLSSEKLSFLIAAISSIIILLALIFDNFRKWILVKLLMGYAAIILLLIPVTFIAIGEVDIVSQSYRGVTNETFAKILSLFHIKETANQLQVLALQHGLAESKEETDRLEKKFRQGLDTLNMLEEGYSKSLDPRAVDYSLITDNLVRLKKEVISSAISVANGNKTAGDEKQLAMTQQNLSDFVNNLISKDIKERDLSLKVIQETADDSFNYSLILMAGSVLLSILVSLFLAWQISRSILQLKSNTEEIAKGGDIKKVPIESDDEIGELAKSFNVMVDALTDSEKKRNEFMNLAAHDLKNPLTVIMAGSSLLSSINKKAGNEKEEKIAMMIHGASSSMLGLLDQLLALNTFKSQGIEIRRREVNLKKFCHDVYDFNVMLAEKKKIDFSLETDLKEEFGYFDSDTIAQVLSNLLSNAFKFSKPAGKVVLAIKSDENTIRFEVKDEAGGIPEEEQDKIFTKFAKLSNRPTAGEDSHGLGLAICKEMIQAHGGTIGFESIPGKGTVFYFNIDTRQKIPKSLPKNSS
jgi:NO-binding membrane sensor protein with MHYT domain/signal transduction histidine kinase